MNAIRQVLKAILKAREYGVQGPSYLLYFVGSWLWPTRTLRQKAFACPHPKVRELLWRRSGLRIGRKASINLGVTIVGIARTPPAVTLGDRVALGPGICFVTSSYPDDSLLCNHPELKSTFCKLGPIVVDDDAWIGANVVIFPKVRIGRGAVIGAGAVVRSDVPPFSVAVGVPARVIRTLAPLDGEEIA